MSLIPETLEATTLGALVAGDPVNLETDILARHVQRLLAFALRPHPRSARPLPLLDTIERRRLPMSLSTIPEALEALRAGRPVIVADDENRENEGDVILSAQFATHEWIAWTVRYSSGFICAPMPADWADRLDLPPMVEVNEDAARHRLHRERGRRRPASTGHLRRPTAPTPCNVLADPSSMPSSVIRPGHILPLRAVDGGVRERGGHTEAAVELMRLAGLKPVGAIGEVVAEDGCDDPPARPPRARRARRRATSSRSRSSSPTSTSTEPVATARALRAQAPRSSLRAEANRADRARRLPLPRL